MRPSRNLLILWLFLLLLPLELGFSAEAKKPNILFIVGDDMGYADVGFHGCKDIPTPNLDALAKSGVRCTSGYVSGVYCSPTRAGLLTGRYQQRFGHEFNPHQGDPDVLGLPTTEVTFADRMRSLGYATGVVGKWHLGITEQFHPLRRGFDEFYGFLGGAHRYFPTPGAPLPRKDDVAAHISGAPVESGGKPVEWEGYLTDRLGAEAASFVE